MTICTCARVPFYNYARFFLQQVTMRASSCITVLFSLLLALWFRNVNANGSSPGKLINIANNNYTLEVSFEFCKKQGCMNS